MVTRHLHEDLDAYCLGLVCVLVSLIVPCQVSTVQVAEQNGSICIEGNTPVIVRPCILKEQYLQELLVICTMVPRKSVQQGMLHTLFA